MKKLFLSLALTFALNFFWEISQVALYKPHFNGVWDLIFVHLRATMGDVIIFILIYVLIGLIFKDRFWIFKNKFLSLFLASVFGFIFAVVVEKYALITGRWGYSDLMPIIPFLKVGLSPVLQMTFLSPLIAFFVGKYAKK